MKLKPRFKAPRSRGWMSQLLAMLNETNPLGLKEFSARNSRKSDRQTVQILAEGDEEKASDIVRRSKTVFA